MKTKIILILFFFSLTNAFSQTKKPLKNSNIPQQSVKESVFIPVLESYYNYTRQNVDTYKTLFDVGYLFNAEKYRPKDTKSVIFDINKFLLSEDKVTLKLGQRYYLNKYKSSIISTMEKLSITNHQIFNGLM